MSLTRSAIKKTETSVKKDASAFIDGAEPNISTTKAIKKELKKPISISLTSTDLGTLDRQVRRYNLISLQENSDIQLNRSDLVRIMAYHLDSLDNDELVNIINKIIR